MHMLRALIFDDDPKHVEIAHKHVMHGLAIHDGNRHPFLWEPTLLVDVDACHTMAGRTPQRIDPDIVVVDRRYGTASTQGWEHSSYWAGANRLIVLKTAVPFGSNEVEWTLVAPEAVRAVGTDWGIALGKCVRSWIDSGAAMLRLRSKFLAVGMREKVDAEFVRQLGEARRALEDLWERAGASTTPHERAEAARHADVIARMTGRALRPFVSVPPSALDGRHPAFVETVESGTPPMPWETLSYSGGPQLPRWVPCARYIASTKPSIAVEAVAPLRTLKFLCAADVDGRAQREGIKAAFGSARAALRAYGDDFQAEWKEGALEDKAIPGESAAIVHIAFHGPQSGGLEATEGDAIGGFLSRVLQRRPRLLVLYGCNSAWLLHARGDAIGSTIVDYLFAHGVEAVVAMQAIVELRDLAARWVHAFYAALLAFNDVPLAAGLARWHASTGAGIGTMDLAATVYLRKGTPLASLGDQ